MDRRHPPHPCLSWGKGSWGFPLLMGSAATGDGAGSSSEGLDLGKGGEVLATLIRDSVPVLVPVLNRPEQKLKQLNQFPDFNNYLIFVLTRLKSEGAAGEESGSLGPRGAWGGGGGEKRHLGGGRGGCGS